jgi:hypothetical protein
MSDQKPETWIVEYGAVSLPLGHPSRITVVEAHRSEELAAASLAKAREDFDAHMWKALDQAALDAAVAAARAEERERWATLCEWVAGDLQNAERRLRSLEHWSAIVRRPDPRSHPTGAEMSDNPTSAPQPVTMNINHMVRVKLTDSGRAALARQHVEFWANAGSSEPYPYTSPKEDADGWSEWQLWVLMQDLGHLCRLGFETPFETTIQLPQAAFDAAVAAARAEERALWTPVMVLAQQCIAAAYNDQWPEFDRLSDQFDDACADAVLHLKPDAAAIRAATPQEPT